MLHPTEQDMTIKRVVSTKKARNNAKAVDPPVAYLTQTDKPKSLKRILSRPQT